MFNIIANYDSITFDEVFIDGTKIEPNANRYTFVWRKSIEKQLIKLVGKLNALKQDVFGSELGSQLRVNRSIQIKASLV